MNVELVAQMFKNYQSNVLFHLEGRTCGSDCGLRLTSPSNGEPERPTMRAKRVYHVAEVAVPEPISRRDFVVDVLAEFLTCC